MLILGRESLVPGRSMPFTEGQVAAGLKVLVLEQMPIVWKGLGLRHQPIMPRRAFMGVKNHPVFAGLDSGDLVNWRGAPDLLPMGKNQAADTRHAPKWTNTHAISSVMLQCPRNIGFTPLLRTSFDLDYTPLLQWQYGKGGIWFSALDLTGRVGLSGKAKSSMTDPAASRLARNLVDYVDTYKDSAEPAGLYVDGNDQIRMLLSRLGATDSSENADSANLIVAGQGGKLDAGFLEKRTRAGATVLVLAQPVDAYAAFGLTVAGEKIQRAFSVEHPVFAGIGPNLLRWRDELAVPVIKSASQDTTILGGGVFAVRKLGAGRIVFMQVSPQMLIAKAGGKKEIYQAVQTSIWRLEQLLSQVLTNLKAPVDARQAERLAFLDLGPQFKVIKHWNVLGPFPVEEEDGEKMLSEKFPGEETAVVGDFNPNNTFTNSEGKGLNWRTTVQADKKGFINLGVALKRDTLAIAYGIAVVSSDTEREAVLRLGADWRMMAWVNGEQVFKTLHGHNKAGAYKVKVKLKKGENLISVKVASGSKGFGFFADLASEAKDGAVPISEDLNDVSFYGEGRMADEFDPFEFHYW
jgi:beta-galactosidase